jgi:hypothetical protein
MPDPKQVQQLIGVIPASQNRLYKVDRVYAMATPEEHVDIKMLHQHLTHIAPNAIRKMVTDGAIQGIQLVDNGSTLTCEACKQAKATCKQICKECKAPLVKAFRDEVPTDLWGPSSVLSLGGRGYYVTFTNDYSHYTKLTPLQSKDQMLDAYKTYASWAKTQHSVMIKCL